MIPFEAWGEVSTLGLTFVLGTLLRLIVEYTQRIHAIHTRFVPYYPKLLLATAPATPSHTRTPAPDTVVLDLVYQTSYAFREFHPVLCHEPVSSLDVVANSSRMPLSPELCMVPQVQIPDASSIRNMTIGVVPYEPFDTTFSLVLAVFFKWPLIAYLFIVILKFIFQWCFDRTSTSDVYEYPLVRRRADGLLMHPDKSKDASIPQGLTDTQCDPHVRDEPHESYLPILSIDTSSLRPSVAGLDDNCTRHGTITLTKSDCLSLPALEYEDLRHSSLMLPCTCQTIPTEAVPERRHGATSNQDPKSELATELPSRFTPVSTQVVSRNDRIQPSSTDSRSTSIDPVKSFDGTSGEVHFWDLPVTNTNTAPLGRLLAASIYAPAAPPSSPTDRPARLSSTLSNTPKEPLMSSNHVHVSSASPDCAAQLSLGSRTASKIWDLKKRGLSSSIHAPKGPTKMPPVMIKNPRPAISHLRRLHQDLPRPRLASSEGRDLREDPCNRSLTDDIVDFPSAAHSPDVSPSRSAKSCMALSIPEHPKLSLDDDISPNALSLSARVIRRPQSMQPSAMDPQADTASWSSDTSFTGSSIPRLHIWLSHRNTSSSGFQVAHELGYNEVITRPGQQVLDVGDLDHLATVMQDLDKI